MRTKYARQITSNLQAGGTIFSLTFRYASDRVFPGSSTGPPFGTPKTRRQEMQRRQLFCAGRMNIAKKQHVFESILAPPLISASAFEFLWIFERTEEHVPQRNIREVVGVMTELVVNPMRFRSLEDIADPRGRVDVPMIEEFTDRDQNCEIASGAYASTKEWIDD
jgi:hypothetical protein